MPSIYHSLNSINEMEMEAFESILGYKLPKDYRDFLLKSNGGRPRPYSFRYSDPVVGEMIGDVNILFGVASVEVKHSILYNINNHKTLSKECKLPIAKDGIGNLIVLSLSKETEGKIYFWDHEIHPDDGNLFFIASSFDEFLESLFEYNDNEET